MNANDLRLGNIVTINNIFSHEKMLNIPLLVCGIEKLRENDGGIIKLNYPNYNDNIVIPAFSQFDKFINPIPLTEEWLLKAGFKKIGSLFYHDSFFACELSSHNELRFEDLDNLYIKYVHQLQNLYFCFCGEELVFSTEP